MRTDPIFRERCGYSPVGFRPLLGVAVVGLLFGLMSSAICADPNTLEEVKQKVHADAAASRLPGGQIGDLILLFLHEERDVGWATDRESEIRSAITSLPLRNYGLSDISVNCATTVCQIVLTQTQAGRDVMDWQMIASDLIGSARWGVAPSETAILVTGAGASNDDGVTAFFTLLQYERPD